MTGQQHMQEPQTRGGPDVPGLLQRWVAQGYVSQEQADRILREEPAPRVPAQAARPPEPVERRATSLVVEALGYLGGVLVIVAAGLLVGEYWDQMSLGVRLGVLGVAAAVLLGAGLAVPQRMGDQGARLRSVLWVLSAGALAFFLALAATDGLEWAGEDAALLAGVGVAAYVGALWWRERTGLLQAGMLAGLVVTVIALSGQLAGVRGEHQALAVWGLGVAWWLLGTGDLLEPRRAATLLGPLVAIGGSMAAAMTDWGLVLGLATVGGVVVVAVLQRDLLLLVLGAVGAFQFVPRVVTEWFPGQAGAALALLVIGLLLLLAAVRIARRWRVRDTAGQARLTELAPRTAGLAAAGVVVGVAAVVAVLAGTA